VSVILRSPDCVGDLTANGIGEVGRLAFADGAAAWVVADEVRLTDDDESRYSEMRAETAARGAEELAYPTAMGWGWVDANGVPILIDLGNPLSGTVRGHPAG